MTTDPCFACGKPLSAHLPASDNCPMFIAEGALSYQQQLEMMAELNGWRGRALTAEDALAAAAERERVLDGWRGRALTAEDALAAAAERERVLVEALMPLAIVGKLLDEIEPGRAGYELARVTSLSVGDLRNASAALAAVQASRGEGT